MSSSSSETVYSPSSSSETVYSPSSSSETAYSPSPSSSSTCSFLGDTQAPPLTQEGEEGTGGKERHCAFCLNPIQAEKVFLCGACRRRAYCSQQCQERDWKVDNNDKEQQRGQGHVDWCGLPAGEEDLDWKVVDVKIKGRGLKALRDIPAGFRVLVEAAQRSPSAHPKTAELTPLASYKKEGKVTEEELKRKFVLNTLGCGDGDAEDFVLCLRMARLNHSCFPNTDHFYDAERGVKILYAVRDIGKDEEITISYINFASFSEPTVVGLTPQERHDKLWIGWDLICRDSLPCQMNDVRFKIAEATGIYRELVTTFTNLGGGEGEAVAAANRVSHGLKGVRKLLGVCEELKLSQREKVAALHCGLIIATGQEKTWKDARDFLAEWVKVLEPICHPREERLWKLKDWWKRLKDF